MTKCHLFIKESVNENSLYERFKIGDSRKQGQLAVSFHAELGVRRAITRTRGRKNKRRRTKEDTRGYGYECEGCRAQSREIFDGESMSEVL